MKKRDLLIVIGAVLAGLLLMLGQIGSNAIPAGAWGLHFSGDGKTPTGPASADLLKKYDAIYAGDPGEKVLYLTFDAGYENGYTAGMLDVLKKHDVKAAFFLVGDYLERNADLVRRMVEEGHIVGNHTVSHPDMRSITEYSAFQQELEGVETQFREITGKELPKFYRPPRGEYSEENLKNAQSLGYKTVFWSLAYADWDNKKQPDPVSSVEKLMNRTHNGAVILLHATSKTNGEILDTLLTRWKAEGYRFETIDKAFD